MLRVDQSKGRLTSGREYCWIILDLDRQNATVKFRLPLTHDTIPEAEVTIIQIYHKEEGYLPAKPLEHSELVWLQLGVVLKRGEVFITKGGVRVKTSK